MIAVATLDAKRRLQWSGVFSHDKHRWRIVRLARLAGCITVGALHRKVHGFALIKRFTRRDEAARRNKISRLLLKLFQG